MKRFIALVLAVFLLLPSAFADAWDCLCGKTGNTGNFCGKCGRSREEALQAQTQADGSDVEAEILSIRNARVGDYVTYGHYPQTTEGNDETPIEWLVLDVQGDKALLLSRYGLDAKPYNEQYISVTWETCTLREWLNEDFLNKAFSVEEQAAIRTTTVDNSDSQGYSGWVTTGGNNTQDKVFLFSYSEANMYLGVMYDFSYTKSQVVPTAYAKKNRAYTSEIHKNANGEATGWWWLRSPGLGQTNAARVNSGGSLDACTCDGSNTVRPALWIDTGAIPGAELTAAPEPECVRELQVIRGAKAGEYVTYGRYPQTAEGNDETPIEWLVLDVQGDKALLLSRYGLDAKPYNTEQKDVTWETCTLREWLNEEFLNKAFSAEEQTAIRTTDVDNRQENSGWIKSGGKNTKDKIFLLSYEEASRYLGVTQENSDNARSRVAPTAYAKRNGAWTDSETRTSDGQAAGWWWLRSPGYEQDNAGYVLYDVPFGNGRVNFEDGLVRPAFWIDISVGF